MFVGPNGGNRLKIPWQEFIRKSKPFHETFHFFSGPGFFANENGSNAVIAFLYSALLTRGFGNVREDMDSGDLPLMAAHGYCSQEMVNLLLVGKAASNTFDDDMVLDGGGGGSSRTVLKGIPFRFVCSQHTAIHCYLLACQLTAQIHYSQCRTL